MEGILLALWNPLSGMGLGVMGRYSVRFLLDCFPESFFVASKIFERPLNSTERRLFSFRGFGGRVDGTIGLGGMAEVVGGVVVVVSLLSTFNKSAFSATSCPSIAVFVKYTVSVVDSGASSSVVDNSNGALDVIVENSSLSYDVLVLISSVSRSVTSFATVETSGIPVVGSSVSVTPDVVTSLTIVVDTTGSGVVLVIFGNTVVGIFSGANATNLLLGRFIAMVVVLMGSLSLSVTFVTFSILAFNELMIVSTVALSTNWSILITTSTGVEIAFFGVVATIFCDGVGVDVVDKVVTFVVVVAGTVSVGLPGGDDVNMSTGTFVTGIRYSVEPIEPSVTTGSFSCFVGTSVV
uniref:Uncharacterized protein n=1 Tax=Anopheles atroparvus TaxID=41427 RepID=A0AAG5DA91_ANOAO